jgi:DNA-directed RNA polymerase specialized sigma24 family protein
VNREDFAGLFDVQYPRVFRYLLWRLRNRDAAEELAAEVFATALTALQKGTEPRQTGSWLIGIADTLATRSVQTRHTEGAGVEGAPPAEQDPEALVLGRRESGMIWALWDSRASR